MIASIIDVFMTLFGFINNREDKTMDGNTSRLVSLRSFRMLSMIFRKKKKPDIVSTPYHLVFPISTLDSSAHIWITVINVSPAANTSKGGSSSIFTIVGKYK